MRVRQIATEDYLAALQTPESQSRFVNVPDDAAMAAMLNAPLALNGRPLSACAGRMHPRARIQPWQRNFYWPPAAPTRPTSVMASKPAARTPTSPPSATSRRSTQASSRSASWPTLSPRCRGRSGGRLDANQDLDGVVLAGAQAGAPGRQDSSAHPSVACSKPRYRIKADPDAAAGRVAATASTPRPFARPPAASDG